MMLAMSLPGMGFGHRHWPALTILTGWSFDFLDLGCLVCRRMWLEAGVFSL